MMNGRKGQGRSHEVTFILKISLFLRYLFYLKPDLIDTFCLYDFYKFNLKGH